MLSSTFFHWQKRVNLSLEEKSKMSTCDVSYHPPLKKNKRKRNKNKTHLVWLPLNELLEDVSSQAVTDLHDVWLKTHTHTLFSKCVDKNALQVYVNYFPEWAGLHVHILFLSLSLVYLACICELTCFTEMPTEHLHLVCDSKSLWVVCAVVTQRYCITAAHTTQGLRKYRGNTNKLM